MLTDCLKLPEIDIVNQDDNVPAIGDSPHVHQEISRDKYVTCPNCEHSFTVNEDNLLGIFSSSLVLQYDYMRNLISN